MQQLQPNGICPGTRVEVLQGHALGSLQRRILFVRLYTEVGNELHNWRLYTTLANVSLDYFY